MIMTELDPVMLARASGRFSADPAFLGHLLRSAGLEPEAIVAALSISGEVALRLALCLNPRTDSPTILQTDIDEIAGHFGIDPRRLLNLFREAQALAALRAGQDGGALLSPGM